MRACTVDDEIHTCGHGLQLAAADVAVAVGIKAREELRGGLLVVAKAHTLNHA